MMSHVVAPSSFLFFLLRMPHLAQFPLSLAAAGSCHWLATTTTTIRRRRRAGHCQEALEPPAFWLPFVGILRRCLMTFDAADRLFFPATSLFFSPAFCFLILSSVCLILFPPLTPLCPHVSFVFGGRHVARLMCRKDM